MNEKPLLEKRLQSERPHYSAPDRFTERVMNRLPDRRPRPSSDRGAWLPLAIAVGATAAIALLVTQTILHRQPLTDPPLVAHSESRSETPEKLKLPEISLAQVQALSTKLDEPLQTELKNVISDTRQAIQFVASNFLPEN